MSNKFFNLVEFGILDNDTLDCLQIREVKFLKDFGPIKKGEEPFCVSFDFTEMECRIFNSDGDETHKFNFELKA